MIDFAISPYTLIFGTIGLFGVVFGIYHYFKNPQIETDKTTLNLIDRLNNVDAQILEIKETHLRSVEKDMKDLTVAVNDLSKTVIKLSTIIDERIPRGAPNLTPPGT